MTNLKKTLLVLMSIPVLYFVLFWLFLGCVSVSLWLLGLAALDERLPLIRQGWGVCVLATVSRQGGVALARWA